jgi:MoxR-like ATPase
MDKESPIENTVNEELPQTDIENSVNSETAFVKEVSDKVINEVQKVLIGYEDLVEMMFAAICVGGHVLLEGMPGLAKTLTTNLLAKSLSVDFKRIQFTPDLMPSDIVGTMMYDIKSSSFSFKKGPIFSNFILADEINRAPAKTQAALFEVMEEKQVTVDGDTRELGFPLFIVATQNPIEQEGTYRLPEAQLDRFIFKLNYYYPKVEEEYEILKRFNNDFNLNSINDINPVFTAEDIKKCHEIIEKVYIKDELLHYIASLVNETRHSSKLFLGASPRASLAIMKTSKAIAAINNRDFVTPDDIRKVSAPVLNHRLILHPEKEIEGVEIDDVINEIINKIEVPR